MSLLHRYLSEGSLFSECRIYEHWRLINKANKVNIYLKILNHARTGKRGQPPRGRTTSQTLLCDGEKPI